MIDTSEVIQYTITGLLGGAAAKTLIEIAHDLRKQSEMIDLENKYKDKFSGTTDSFVLVGKKASSPMPNASVKLAFLQGAADLVMLAGGAYGGYKLVDFIAEKIKKNVAKSEEQKAKEEYFKTLHQLSEVLNPKQKESSGVVKTAALNTLYWLGAGALALNALAAITTARAAYEARKRQKPDVDLEKLTAEVNSSLVAAPVNNKVNNTVISSDIKAEIPDNLKQLELVLTSPSQSNIAILKTASAVEPINPIGLNDVIKVVALGYGEDLVKWASEDNDIFERSSEFINNLKNKGVNLKTSSVQDIMAIGYLAHNKKCAAIIVPIAAANILEAMPEQAKIAEGVMKTASVEDRNALIAFGNAFLLSQQNEQTAKYASVLNQEFKVSDTETLLNYVSKKHANANDAEGKLFLDVLSRNSTDEHVLKLQKVLEFKF